MVTLLYGQKQYGAKEVELGETVDQVEAVRLFAEWLKEIPIGERAIIVLSDSDRGSQAFAVAHEPEFGDDWLHMPSVPGSLRRRILDELRAER